MATFTDEELFGPQQTSNKPAPQFTDADLLTDIENGKVAAKQAEHVRSTMLRAQSVGVVERSLRHAGFDDVAVEAGLPQDTQDALAADRRGVSKIIEEDEQLKQSAFDLAATQEFRESVELLRALPEARSLLDIQTEQLESIPAALRPFAVGAAQTAMRSSSLIARGFSVLGFDTAEVADDLARESGQLGQAQVQAGAGEIEQAATSAVSSIMQVMTAGGLGLGQKGIAIAFGVSSANDAITEGRDAGLEGVQLARFSATQGIIEGVGTLLFNKLLGPGVERLGSLGRKEFNQLIQTGTKGVLKKFALTGLAELPEEITIELLQSLNSQLEGVDPTALNAENVLKLIRQTTMATLMTAGATTGLETVVARVSQKQKSETQPTKTDGVVAKATEILENKEDSIRVTKKRLAELKAEATEDQLTGLGNRRVDERAVATLFKRADRENQEVSLVSFDIANFKSLNDNLGLQAGDKALQIIADSIQAELRGERKGRQNDVAGVATRPGGDEFNILLPNTTTKGAQALADRISTRVDAALKAEGLQLPVEGRPVFAAPGVVTRAPNDTRSVEDLRKEADFEVKARKKAVKTELGVPLTREEAEPGKTPESSTPPASQEAPGPSAPAKTEAVSGAATPPTGKTAKQPVTKPVVGAVKPRKAKTGKIVKVRKRVTKKVTPAGELKAELTREDGTTQSKFSTEGFRKTREFAQEKLTDLKAKLTSDKVTDPKDIKQLTDLARTVLPLAERGKLIPGIGQAKTRRALLAQVGRISKAVESQAHAFESARLKNEQKKLKKLGRKIPTPVRGLFGDDVITNLRTTDPRILTSEAVKVRADQIAQLRGVVKELNDLKLGTEKKGAVELQDQMVGTMRKAKPKQRDETGRASKPSEFFNEQSTKPEELLAAMGPEFVQAFQTSMNVGEEITMRINRQFSENFSTKFDMAKMAKWGATAGTKVKKAGFQLTSGRKLELTYMELAMVIASGQTPANRAAILKSGLTLRRRMHDNKVVIAEADFDLLTTAAKKLDPDILKLATEAKRYLNEDLKPQYDTAFQELNNYSNIIDEYLPIARNRQDFLQLPKDADFQALNNFTLEQIRETKERRGSNASVLIDGLDSVLDSHVRRVGLYIGQARPMRNANIMLNMPGVATEMDSRYGTQRRKWLQERMDHAVQSAIGFTPGGVGVANFLNRTFSKLVTNSTVGVLGLNPFVAVKQVASFATAMTQMDAKFLLRGALKGTSAATEARMLEHSPQAWTRYNVSRIRLVGQFVDATQNIFQRQKLQEKFMGLITRGDKVVILSIWRGAEIEVAEAGVHKIGSEAYWAAVNKKWNQVVQRSQPTTSVFDQPGLALEGRTNSLAKLAGAMFMSQRNQNFTMIRRATREGGTTMWRDLGLTVAVAPALVVLVDLARAAAYGYEEDMTASERVYDGLFRMAETNLSVIYGSQLVIEALQPVKQAVLGETIAFRRRENVVSASASRVGRGIQDLAAALAAGGKTIEGGPARGRSVRTEKLQSALNNLVIGIGTLKGIPVSTPAQALRAAGEWMWAEDYGILFKERTKLRKLDKEGKLSDFQRERLNVIEENFEVVNVVQRAVKLGAIEQADANQYASDRMRTTAGILAQLETTVPKQTLTPKEKAPEDEVLLGKFYAEHGSALVKFQVQHKEASLVEARFNRIARADQRAFLAADPGARDQIRGARRSRRLMSTLTKLRKKLTDPHLAPGLRASFNARVTKILQEVGK
jgi:diguanylate cyclase (GGDEF)-like protein